MAPPQLSEAEVAELVRQTILYAREQRHHYFPLSNPLSPDQATLLRPFFSHTVLANARVVVLRNESLSNPRFLIQLKESGFPISMDMNHINAATYFDVQVMQHTISDRILFHGLVHTVQSLVLGEERVVDLYVRSVLRNGMHVTIPLEAHAYELDHRFADNPSSAFLRARRSKILGRRRPLRLASRDGRSFIPSKNEGPLRPRCRNYSNAPQYAATPRCPEPPRAAHAPLLLCVL